MRAMTRAWAVLFLEERPSATLGLFRIATALTVGLHVIPTLLQLQDNYLAGSFREYNAHFFPPAVLAWAHRQPDSVVWASVWAFVAGWLGFLLGLFTQLSGALMAAACYFFYARNSLHIGTLSWDILLVTVALMIVTPYPGDAYSLDAVRRGDERPWARLRPVFLLRLLQMQLASTFFYTGLNKIAAGGNWWTGNPYWHLLNGPASGVMKDFPLRDWLVGQPQACYWLGTLCVALELSTPLWLWWRRTRPWAVAAGMLFQAHLLLTMHVPTIFFFLFTPQFLLFLDPELLLAWILRRRRAWEARGRYALIMDGGCGFCRASLARLQALDYEGRLEAIDFRAVDASRLHPDLTPEACEREVHLLEPGGALSRGFYAYRRLALRLPALWPVAPLLHLPGVAWVGERVYAWVAVHRFRLSACPRPDA